ncbi:hypothetical protein Tco_0529899 [Tanacetum coccineum]
MAQSEVDLITDDIRGRQYYNAYLEKVAKNQRYLAGEDVTKPAPAKPREKKRKQALDAAEALSLAKRSKAGRISKKRMLQLRDEFIYEGVPVTEPRVDDEEAIVQTVLEESMKDAYPAHRGPPPLVVFREPDSGKLQPLPEVQGKGKENVGKEQAAQVLLNLQTPKKKNPAEQFIFQRCTPATAEPSSPIFVTICGTGPGCPGDAGLSRTPSSHVVHAGLNLDHMDLGIAEASSQPNTEQMDDEFTATAYPKDLSFTDQFLVEKSQEDEPKKTNTEVQVQSMVTVPILQDTSSIPLMTTPVIYITDPQSDSITVLASMPTTTETVTETTTTTVLPPPPQPQQDVSTSILIQTIGQLEQNIADLEIDQKIEESLKEVVTASVQHAMRAPLRARFKDLPTSDMKEILLQRLLEENYDKGHEDHKMAYEALQKSIIRDESEKFNAYKAEERTKKKSKQDSPKTPPGSPPSPPPHPPPSGVSGAFGTTRASDSAQDPPPPPPSSTTNQGDQSQSFAAPGSSKTDASTAYTAWTITTSGLKPAALSVPEYILLHEELDSEAQDMVSDDEDSGSRHIPKVSLNQK